MSDQREAAQPAILYLGRGIEELPAEELRKAIRQLLRERDNMREAQASSLEMFRALREARR